METCDHILANNHTDDQVFFHLFLLTYHLPLLDVEQEKRGRVSYMKMFCLYRGYHTAGKKYEIYHLLYMCMSLLTYRDIVWLLLKVVYKLFKRHYAKPVTSSGENRTTTTPVFCLSYKPSWNTKPYQFNIFCTPNVVLTAARFIV